jgi:RNA polymerase-binding transcription factor DksA
MARASMVRAVAGNVAMVTFSEDASAASADAAAAGVRPVEETVAALAAAERALAAVDRALEALDAGRYGICAVCAAPIDDADLAADPTVTHCSEHRRVL